MMVDCWVDLMAVRMAAQMAEYLAERSAAKRAEYSVGQTAG